MDLKKGFFACKKKMKIRNIKMKKGSIEQYRSNITLHLTRISGDLEHIKEKVDDNNKHLEKINGRLRAAENDITAVKTVGGTITFIIGVVLAWLGIDR